MGVAMLQGAWPPSAGESLVHHTTPPVVWGAEPQRGGDCLPLGLRTPQLRALGGVPRLGPFSSLLPQALLFWASPGFPCLVSLFLPSQLLVALYRQLPYSRPHALPSPPGLLSQLSCETRAFDPRGPRSVSSLLLTFKKIIIKRKVTRLLVSPVGREMHLSHNRFGKQKAIIIACLFYLLNGSLTNPKE